MGYLNWLTIHWLDLLQSIGIIGGLGFTAYTTRKDERARGIGNSIAINAQYRQIWTELYERPTLARVLNMDVDLEKEPVSLEENLFVTMLILHLSTVYQAMEQGEFVKLEGLKTDVKDFFVLPIPGAVWRKSKPLQNHDFADFVESALK